MSGSPAATSEPKASTRMTIVTGQLNSSERIIAVRLAVLKSDHMPLAPVSDTCTPSPWRRCSRVLRSSAARTMVLASAWGCGSTATKEGSGEYVDDSVITAKVKSAIFSDSTLKVNEINVETFKGVVQLSGFVSSQVAQNTAVDVTRNVAGVKSVKNDMRLK